MVDPMEALVKLQEAIGSGLVRLKRGDIHSSLGVWMDEPNGKTRITYAKVTGRKVEAVALFVHNGYLEGVPCFQAGYAVVESMRSKGFASDLVLKAIEEMSNGFGRNGAKRFYIEAVVGEKNAPSNKLAKCLLSDAPESITDDMSGEPALRYVKLIECGS